MTGGSGGSGLQKDLHKKRYNLTESNLDENSKCMHFCRIVVRVRKRIIAQLTKALARMVGVRERIVVYDSQHKKDSGTKKLV